LHYKEQIKITKFYFGIFYLFFAMLFLCINLIILENIGITYIAVVGMWQEKKPSIINNLCSVPEKIYIFIFPGGINCREVSPVL
jgi:hypothetical protein